MCLEPVTLPSGDVTGCRKCWQCTSTRVQDWVGRCIAEGEDVVASHSVTLTYGGGDHERAAVLTYSDVQKFFKTVRKAGFPVRYFVVGEFGGAKGRTHWHGILYWLTKAPNHLIEGEGGKRIEVPIPLKKRFNHRWWPHGYAYFDEVHSGSVLYCCKYLQKDLRDSERQGRLAMSKSPPLGARYFDALAQRYVEQGISPQVAQYHFRGVLDGNGRPQRFHLHRQSRDLFLGAFVRHWTRLRGGHWPHSDLVADYLDRAAGYTAAPASRPFQPSYGKPWIKPPKGGQVIFDEPRNSWCWLGATETLFWSFDDEGRRAWHAEIRTEAQAERLREASDRRAALPSYREASRAGSIPWKRR